MKKLMMFVAILLGTTAMVNAQTTPAKEVKAVKHAKKAAPVKIASAKSTPTKMEATKAKK